MIATTLLALAIGAGLELPPRFQALQALGENASLGMTCEGAPPFDEIRCRFTEVQVQVPTEAEVAARLALRVKELEAAGVDLAALRKACAEPRVRLPGLSPARQAADDEAAARREELCRCDSKGCVLAASRKAAEAELRECRLHVSTTEPILLKREAPDRWAGAVLLPGSCEVVVGRTLVREEDRVTGWNLLEVRAARQAVAPGCGGPEQNGKRAFSWRAPPQVAVACTRLNLRP